MENNMCLEAHFRKISYSRGVNKLFKTLAKLASSFTRQVRKQLAKNIERLSEREKTNSPDWRLGLYWQS
jgi:hypothetical protein